MEWKRVSLTFETGGGSAKQLQRYAVVIANFEPPQGPNSDKFLRLVIGDIVIVEKVFGGWYFGHLLSNTTKCGAFPGNYLKFKDGVKCSRVHQNSICEEGHETGAIYDSPMVQEVSTVLRAWIKCCREAYVERRIDDVLPVVSLMQDVTKRRKQILSGKLPVDEVKSLKQKIGRKIDVGNKKLGLDLVVRDKAYETAIPEKCSVMELYSLHVAASERIEQDLRTNVQIQSLPRTLARQSSVPGHVAHSKPLTAPSNSNSGGSSTNVSSNRSLFVNILDFNCREGGDVELSLALYDAREQQFISEFFTMVWPKFAESPEQVKRRPSVGAGAHGHKVLFSDLGTKDLSRDRFYLICRVVRTGSFENSKEHTSSFDGTSASGGSGSNTMTGRRTQVRQLYAVGAMELRDALQITAIPSITNALKTKHGHESDQERHWFFPIIPCFDDHMDQVLKRVVESRQQNPLDASPGHVGRQVPFTSAEVIGNHSPANLSSSSKEQGIWLSLQLMVGNAEEAKATYAHVFTSPPAVVRKMGFPEVISSADVRNDLYVTLVGGDFSHISRSNLNIEVKACMVDDKGMIQPHMVSTIGPKLISESYYTSTVHYHEDKPRWGEIFKMSIPVETYGVTHVRFTFKHRPRNESKDKTEKPFAIAFIRLTQSNETIIGNGAYDLVVYKVDRKFEEQSDVSYVSLPSTRLELERWMQTTGANTKAGPSVSGVTLSPKDSFQIRTVVCSTSLTQNVDLLGLLNWRSKRNEIKQSLESLKRSEVERTGEEIVKFLHNVLDALFQILMELNEYDQLVFDCLVYVIGLVSEHRYSSFKPILDEYLKSNFCAALAYQKLITSFIEYLDNVEERYDRLLSALKTMEYLMKFIVRSKQLRVQLKGSVEDFVRLMNQLLQSISDLMCLRTDHSIVCQGAGLRYLPYCVSDIAQAYDGRELACFIRNTLKNVPEDRLQKEKLWCIQNLIKSDFYKRNEYRRVLQPSFLRIVCANHIERDNELDICAVILSDLMTVLYGVESTCHPQPMDLQDILKYQCARSGCAGCAECNSGPLRAVVQVIIRLIEQHYSQVEVVPSSRLTTFVALFLAILSRLDAEVYDHHVANRFLTGTDRIDFITELLMLFNDMIEKTIFPPDWFQMICKRNSVILEILRFITSTIKKYFLHKFEVSVWTICFRTLVAFITQRSLQLEQFPPEKRNEVLRQYGDMREICACYLAPLWRSMNFAEKRSFIPNMVGPFLEVTLLSQQQVREKTIPIFYDMMFVGLYQTCSGTEGGSLNTQPCSSDSETFERELLTQLNTLVEQGRGDHTYIEAFEKIMESRRMTSPFNPSAARLNEMGGRLTTSVNKLLTKLLEFREVRQRHDCLDNRMSCTQTLLEFCDSINHVALYVQYVHKLYELHMDCDNYAEAAFTLKLHADKLRWIDDSVQPSLLSLLPESYRGCTTERTLKEKLYYEILALLDKGQLWERAIGICHELQNEYEQNTFDYVKLSWLMGKMSKLYQNIMSVGQVRVAPEYYRVAFYGQGFPGFLRDKVFIYRGQPGERQPEFTARMKTQYPEAQEMTVLTPPTQEQLQSTKQLLQINKADPRSDSESTTAALGRFKGRKVDSRVSWYYKTYEVQKFAYTRKIPPPKLENGDRRSGVHENEFSSMWLERTVIVASVAFPGVMRWFPVISSSTSTVGPLEVAVETMQEATKQLVAVTDDVERLNGHELKPLAAKLQGMLQPAVMGGISNYEKTFFTDAYEAQCGPKELAFVAQLKDLIAGQIPLLEKGLYLHARYCPEEQLPFHQMVLDHFYPYKQTVEEKYGRKPSLIPPNSSLVPLRQPQRTLMKHTSVDGVGTSSSASDLTFKRQGTKDWSSGTATWGLRQGLSAFTAGGMSTVPRRNPTQSTTFVKRKGSQDLCGREISERQSNVSAGSTLSVELLGNESGPLGTSTPVGNAAIVNGILTVTEHVTPQRPPRPPSSATAPVGVRSNTRSGSMHSLLMGSHEITAAPTNGTPDSAHFYDRVTTPLRCHSFDSLQDGDSSAAPPPTLPPRRPSLSLAAASRQQTVGTSTLNRHGAAREDIKEEDESVVPTTMDSVSTLRASSQHSFVIPRRPKPLPPRPIENENNQY